jgi:hypothetical protein
MIINVSSSFEIFERGPMLTLSLGLDIGPGGGSFVIWGSLGAGSAETLFLFYCVTTTLEYSFEIQEECQPVLQQTRWIRLCNRQPLEEGKAKVYWPGFTFKSRGMRGYPR